MDVTKLMACQDCLFLVANGDLPDDRPDLDDEIAAHLGDDARWLCCGDSAADDEFSRSTCECCGSRLGGSRHELCIVKPATQETTNV
jgi:hypothetical protein